MRPKIYAKLSVNLHLAYFTGLTLVFLFPAEAGGLIDPWDFDQRSLQV